ncbi:V-type ATP synthase subunit D [uncultured archaeon]|nr:V-type ATP synthase subunit D [uncultured archaeon]
MARINPTRMNLINLKKSVKLAAKGHGLLRKKREALVMEFFKILQKSEADRSRLQEMLSSSYKTTAIASTFVGDFELEQAGARVTDSSAVSLGVRNVMGVRIPVINAEFGARKTSGIIQTNIAVSDVEDAFLEVKLMIIEIAKREQGLRRLVLEIDKVKRRVNALENIVIPNLKKQSSYISLRLNEMDRDTFSSLKHVKKRLAKAQS